MRLRKRLSYANVVSTICLFLVLGGGAYAATKLPKNSVGSKQIKDGQVKSVDVKNASLLEQDFMPGQLPQGEQGPTGLAGEDGADGRDGVDGEDGADGQDGLPGPAVPAALHSAGLGDFQGNCTLHSPTTASYDYDPTNRGEVGYYRDTSGFVWLTGAIVGCGPGSSGFTLPAGFAPDHLVRELAVYNDNTERIVTVRANGIVSVDPSAAGDFTVLDGVGFRCGPAGQAGCP